MAQREIGIQPPIMNVPFAVASLAGHAAKRWADRTGHPPLLTPAAVRIARLGLRADCTKAKQRFGMEHAPVEIAVRDALIWFAREGYVRDPHLVRRLLAAAPSTDASRRERASANASAALG